MRAPPQIPFQAGGEEKPEQEQDKKRQQTKWGEQINKTKQQHKERILQQYKAQTNVKKIHLRKIIKNFKNN